MNKKSKLIVSLSLSFMVSSSAYALTGKEIMTKNEEARRLSDVTSSATLKTGGGGKPDRLKQFTWWRKLTSDNIHYNTLTRFHVPAEIRGEGVLFLEQSSGENDVMMYLPNFKKIRRVESQQQSGSFMGSEFSYSDIATDHVDDFEYKVIRDENCPTEEASKIKCSVIESKPANDKVKDRTGHSKTTLWIRQDNFMGVKGEYYDLNGTLWKRMEASQIKMVDPVKKNWMAQLIRMESAKDGRFTVLEFSQVKANAGIPDSVFSQQNLSRVK